MGHADHIGESQQRLRHRFQRRIRLALIDVEPRPAQMAAAQRLQQRPVIHQPAARGVDEDGARLHGRQLPRADEMAGLRAQGRVDAHIVAVSQKRRQIGEGHALRFAPGKVRVGRDGK